jgi:hypothetical protein
MADMETMKRFCICCGQQIDAERVRKTGGRVQYLDDEHRRRDKALRRALDKRESCRYCGRKFRKRPEPLPTPHGDV